ncbi:MAG: YfiR family protein [Magnetococcales bacterium]|nr:YfiR family protein [Magnetococcales bacterium]
MKKPLHRPLNFLLGLLLAVSLVLGFSVRGVWAAPSEAQVKVVFLYNFTKFVEWPSAAFPNSESPFQVCVMGQDSFGSLLMAIKKKSVRGRPLNIRRPDSLAETDSCHLLFVSESEKSHSEKIIQAMLGKPILTVGESDGFADKGGMIHFFIEKGAVRFVINREAIKKAGLTVSSRLLRVGRLLK